MTEDVKENRTERTVGILRALANWLERHPQADVSLPGMWTQRLYQMMIPRNPEDLAEKVRAIGSCRKQPCKNQPKDYEFVVDLLPDFELVFWCQRDKVCTPRVVGQKLVPEEIVPEKITPEHYEDIVEWDCGDSILAELSPEDPDVPVEFDPEGYAEWAEKAKEYKD